MPCSSTNTACLSGRIESSYLDDLPSMKHRFIFQHGNKLSPTAIKDCLGKMPVSDHAPDIKRFETNCLVFTNKSHADLVAKVFPRILHFGVGAGYGKIGLSSVVRTFLLSGSNALKPCKSLGLLGKMLRIGNLFTCRENSKVLNSKVKADSITTNKGLNVFQAVKNDIPLPVGFADNRTGRRLTWKLSMPNDLERTRELGKKDLSFPEGKPTFGIFSRLARILFLELGIAGLFTEKLLICLVEVAQCLLQRSKWSIFEPRRFGIMAHADHKLACLAVRKVFLVVLPTILPFCKGGIIDHTNATKSLEEILLLGFGRIKSITVRNAKHAFMYHRLVLTPTTKGSAFLSGLKAEVSGGKSR